MKSKLLTTTLLLGLVALSGITASGSVQAASADMKTDAQRKQYLEAQKRKIDKQAESQIDRVRDGQKGLANSGASQKRIEQIEKERDTKKKALDDHYKQGTQRDVVGLDGKRKAAPAPSKKAPQYVVGIDGKRKLKNP